MVDLVIHPGVHTFAASAVNLATKRVETSWAWYIIRAAGFIAAGLLVLLMLSGIGQATGIIYRYIEPVKAWAIHKAIALALCASIFIHASFLLIDRFRPFTLGQVTLPLVSHYNNGTHLLGLALGGLAVSFGILAMYGVVIMVLTSLYWIDSKRKTWRTLHYLSYVIAIFIFLHALYVGSDLKYGSFRAAWILLGLVVFIAILARLWRAGTMKKSDNDDPEN